ncbi:hypothetical protein NQZ68_014096 [Dissostichus eleginoides]|nr:hypothetical protein NQZ68_014096 [Dissostichus eleginoides]
MGVHSSLQMPQPEFYMGQPPSAYLNTKSPVERHDALPDTLPVLLVGLDWKHSPSTTAKTSSSPHITLTLS